MDLRPSEIAQWHRLHFKPSHAMFREKCSFCQADRACFDVKMASLHQEYAVQPFPVCPDCMSNILLVADEIYPCARPTCSWLSMEIRTSVPEALMSHVYGVCSSDDIGEDTAETTLLSKGCCPCCAGASRGYPDWYIQFQAEKAAKDKVEKTRDELAHQVTEPQRRHLEVGGCQVSYGFVPFHTKHPFKITSLYETHVAGTGFHRYVIYRAFTRKGVPLHTNYIEAALRHARHLLTVCDRDGIECDDGNELYYVPIVWDTPRINGVRMRCAFVVDVEVLGPKNFKVYSGESSPLIDITTRRPTSFLSAHVDVANWPACLMPFALVSNL